MKHTVCFLCCSDISDTSDLAPTRTTDGAAGRAGQSPAAGKVGVRWAREYVRTHPGRLSEPRFWTVGDFPITEGLGIFSSLITKKTPKKVVTPSSLLSFLPSFPLFSHSVFLFPFVIWQAQALQFVCEHLLVATSSWTLLQLSARKQPSYTWGPESGEAFKTLSVLRVYYSQSLVCLYRVLFYDCFSLSC